MLVIEKNIPIPDVLHPSRGEQFKELFGQLELGDSFECDDTVTRRNHFHKLARDNGIKISVRATTNNKIRTWRVG